jgi:cytochrome c biogenesis protein CcmG/thiol:disulfide interchange protein DsbE
MTLDIRRPALAAAALALLLSPACTRKAAPPAGTSGPPTTTDAAAAASSALVQKPAADFTLAQADGTKVKLSDYRGKVVLLNFWGTWCPPCKVEIPWFVDLQQRLGPKGFTVIGVAMHEDNGWKDVTPFAADRHINYPVVMGDDTVDQAYGSLMIFPTSFLIDRTGKIASVHQGIGIGKDGLEKAIAPLLD